MRAGQGRILICFIAALLVSAAVLTVATAVYADDMEPETDTEPAVQTEESAEEDPADSTAETEPAENPAEPETGTSAGAAEERSVWTVTYMQKETILATEEVADGQLPAAVPETDPDGRTILFWKQDGSTVSPSETAVTADTVYTAVTAGLVDSSTHTAYATGTEAGLFSPNDPLTRAEAASMLYSLLACTEEGPYTSTWPDVPEEHEAYEAITILSSQGILTGYEDGTFRPDQAMTRSELVAVMTRFFPMESGDNPFPDVPEDYWAYPYILSAAAKGWLSGYDDGTFHPDDTITRAEAVALINTALGRDADAAETEALLAEGAPCIFVDVSPDDPFYADVLEATTDHTCTTDSGSEVWTAFTLTDCGYAEGMHQIGSFLYHVNSSLQFDSYSPGTAVIGDQIYYVNSDGLIPALTAGVQELEDGLYCVLEDGSLAVDTQVGELWFGSDGKYTTGNAELDAMVQAALAECVTSDMTQSQKLRAAYVYVRDHYTYLSKAHVAHGTTDWAEEYAVWMFTYGKGNCYCFAAAFMYMARQLGYDATVVSGSIYLFNSVIDHSWTMIDGLLYDTETEYAYLYRYSTRASYNLYGLNPSSAPFTYYFP